MKKSVQQDPSNSGILLKNKKYYFAVIVIVTPEFWELLSAPYR